MDYLRQLQAQRPVVFWIVMLVGIWLGFQLILFVAQLILDPFDVPAWAPLALVLVALVVIARRQNSR